MKISVVTVCYNSAATIEQCLQSIASQTWPDIEHIVIDGASSDGTLDIVKKYDNAQSVLVSEPDNGVYDAMNKGLAKATGGYVSFLNSDDLYSRPDAVELAAKKAIETDAECIMGDVQFFDGESQKSINRFYSAKGFSLWWIKIGVMPPHPGLFVKRSLLIDAGGFDESFKISADFDLVARILLRHNANWATLDQTITLFRSGGLSTGSENVRSQLTKEAARSLSNLSIRGAKVRVFLRLPFKVLQYLPSFSS